MGKPKALLPHADGVTTFVAHAIRTARAAGVENILVVARPDDRALMGEVTREDAAVVINAEPERGQLSSLLAGLDEAVRRFDADAVIVMPVDVPMVTPEGVRRLLDRAASVTAPIVRASAGGRHGHPVIFKRGVFAELRDASPSVGAKAVVHRDPARVLDVDVGDPGVALDVDTPDDYRRAFGRPL